MSQGVKRRRHDLTLGDKMNMIRLIDSHTSQTDIAKMYNCSQSQISRIVSKRDDIIADWEACDDPAKKRSRFTIKEQPPKKKDTIRIVTDQSTSPGPPSENESYDRSEQTRTPYSSNNGLVEYWKNHSASYGRRSYSDFDSDYSPMGRYPGSSGRRGVRGRPKPSLNKESRISNQMLDILKSYDVCDVYCADELALLYDAMPSFENPENEDADEGDVESDKKDTTTIGNQKQITVFLTCNVTGSDKREFLIIEDSKQREATPAIAGCHRARAPHAWMTADVYKEYLLALNYDMRKQKRYILLLVDNAPPHDPEAGKSLEHVRVLYIRSYTTPFFHGIFYSVRAHYRKQILLKLFANNPDITTRPDNRGKRRSKDKTSPPFVLNIDFEEAINMLKQAWQSVCPQELVQCFSKAGICAPHIHGLPDQSDDDLPELPDGFITDEQYEDFVNIDVDAECSGDADLVSSECRILSVLREQGFVDVESDPNDDRDVSMDGLGFNASRKAAFNSTKMDSMTMTSSAGSHSENRHLVDSSGEIERSLSTLRNILAQRGLPLHHLHALESQIYSCHSGGQVQKEEKYTPSN